VVSEQFAQIVTRRRYCELVGIHMSTLKRWERAGVVRPELKPVIGIMTWIFSAADVEFGRRLAELLGSRPGELSLAQAAEIVRSGKRGSR
jgi:hypothetical protein